MERRSTISSRLSLSTSNLSSPPLADSTHINSSSNTQAKFAWGGKVSPFKKYSGSNSPHQSNISKVTMSPISKIDPRIYTDVQSRGLASRIVKYHDNTTKLNRSFSTNSLYTKPGEFPVVHLKKSEVRYKPVRNQNVSMVRIPPPDKSVFHANTRSSILRTGSIVPTISLRKSDDIDSRENRPIVPPAENDVNPTRSVLDALKEISRKRINSEDVDCMGSGKKYCKEPDDRQQHSRQVPSATTYNSIMSKRQRDALSSPDSPDGQLDHTQQKRICTKNNEISSSISSSLVISTPKRKLQDIHGRSGISTGQSSDSPTPPLAKQQCNTENYVPNLFDIDHMQQLTPIPPTPAIEPLANEVKLISEIKIHKPAVTQKPKLTLFNKDYDETTTLTTNHLNDESNQNSNDNKAEEGLAGIPFVKPKNKSTVLKGKNALIERVQETKLSLMLSCLRGDLNNDNDEEDVVDNKTTAEHVEPAKPELKETSEPPKPETVLSLTKIPEPISTSVVATSETATTSAAATTLSLNTAPTTKGFTLPTSTQPITTTTSTNPKLQGFAFNSTTTTSELSKAPPAYNFATPQATTISSTTTPTSTSSVATGGFSFGLPKTAVTTPSRFAPSDPELLRFGAPKPATTSALVTSSLSTAAPTTFTITSSAMNAPSPGFNFSSNTAASQPSASITSSTPAFSSPLITSSKVPVFGSATPAAASTIPLFGSVSNNTPTFGSFSSSTIAPVASDSKISPPKFGESTAATINQNTGFNFGGNKPTTTAAGNVFGSNTNNNLTTTSSFGFGGNDNKTLTPAPSFNFSKPSMTNPSTTDAQQKFSFGGLAAASSSNAPQPTASSSTFGFNATPATTTKSFTFGSTTPTFGSNNNTQLTTASSFNTTKQAQSTASVFGSNTSSGFGASNVAPPAFGSSVSTSNMSFGSPAQIQSISSGFGSNIPSQSTAPTFGSSSSSSSTSALQQNASTGFGFGSAAGGGGGGGDSKSVAFNFGGGSASTTNKATQQVKPFSFGGSSTESAFTTVNTNNNSAGGPGGFSFNSPQTPQNNKNVFGTTTASATKPFSFGGQNTSNPSESKPTASIFGANNNNPAPSTFGSSAGPSTITQGKMFNFGGTSTTTSSNVFGNASASANGSTNLFGNVSSVTPANNSTSLFGVSAATTNNKQSGGQLFNFSGSNSQQNTNNATTISSAAAPFSFGSVQQQQQQQSIGDANKPFAFGGGGSGAGGSAGNNNLTQQASPFGNNGNKPPAYNFTGANQGQTTGNDATNMNNFNANALPPTNLFTAGLGAMANTRERQIRTATRRLKPNIKPALT